MHLVPGAKCAVLNSTVRLCRERFGQEEEEKQEGEGEGGEDLGQGP